MTAFVTTLLALHGAIHVLGFLKWSRLAAVPQLSGRTRFALSRTGEQVFAVGWLGAMLLLVGGGALRLAGRDEWWVVALPGVLLSQGLIVVVWWDAKFGTVANVLLAMAVVVAAARAHFVQGGDVETRAVLAEARSPGGPVDQPAVENLPPPVRTWLRASGVVGRSRTATVWLRQRGALRARPGGEGMPAEAEQVFSVEPPAFVWRVDATMMHVVPLVGRDTYRGGRGRMLIKAGALVPIVDARDDKIDVGSMLRYLGEMIWFPSAAVGPHVTWEAIDATHARARMRDDGREVTAVFTFGDGGRVVRFDANRYLGGGPSAKLTPWFATCAAWGRFDGVEVPTAGEVGWNLPEGPFVYYRWEILELKLTPPA